MEKTVKLMKELSKAVQHNYQKQATEIMQRAKKYYKAMLEVTGNKEKSYAFVADNFNGHAEDTSRTIRLLCKTPFFYKLGPAIMKQILLKAFGKNSYDV